MSDKVMRILPLCGKTHEMLTRGPRKREQTQSISVFRFWINIWRINIFESGKFFWLNWKNLVVKDLLVDQKDNQELPQGCNWPGFSSGSAAQA